MTNRMSNLWKIFSHHPKRLTHYNGLTHYNVCKFSENFENNVEDSQGPLNSNRFLSWHALMGGGLGGTVPQI